MKLPVYKSLTEKKGWFHPFVINTKLELEVILEYHRANYHTISVIKDLF